MRSQIEPSPSAMTAEINRLGHITLRDQGLSLYIQTADGIASIREALAGDVERELDAGLAVNVPASITDDCQSLSGWAF